MPLDRIDHFSIRTLKLEETRTFYENAIGMEAVDRPPLPFPGYWLYLGDHPGIQGVRLKRPDRPFKNSKRSLSRTYGRRNEPLPTICRRSKQYYP